MPADPNRILILGGTAEARELARRLDDDVRFYPLTSLKGVTRAPSKIAGDIRTGGFGGVDGLADFLRKECIILIVDATHPFAAQISGHAVQASRRSGVPCLRLERPPWDARSGDDWVQVKDIAAAVSALPSNAKAFVTVGRQEVAAFFMRKDILIVARMIEEPDAAVPDNAKILLARPPFSFAQEKALMRDHRITMLVAKNSGGDATYAKIEAARALKLPVIMIERPSKTSLTRAMSVDEMIELIEQNIP